MDVHMNNDTIAIVQTLAFAVGAFALFLVYRGLKKQNNSWMVKILRGLAVILTVVALVMCAVSLVASLFVGIFPFVCALIGMAVILGGVLGISLHDDLKKIEKNTIFIETVKYCKEHDISGIRITSEKIYFYTGLLNELCVNDCYKAVEVKNKEELTYDYSGTDFVEPIGGSEVGQLRFASKGYESLPDWLLSTFGKALVKHLDGYGMSSHNLTKYYIERTGGGVNGFSFNSYTGRGTATYDDVKETRHKIVIYDDCFVYKKEMKEQVVQRNCASAPVSQYKKW